MFNEPGKDKNKIHQAIRRWTLDKQMSKLGNRYTIGFLMKEQITCSPGNINYVYLIDKQSH